MVMFNKGYTVWKIEADEFYKTENLFDQMLVLLKYASLAPSTFNSQPWRCRINDNQIEVYLDTDRMPKESDKTGRFAFFSIGCFIENLYIASNYFGFTAII